MTAVYLGEAVSRRPEIYVNRVRYKIEGRFQSVENAESFLKGRSSRALVRKRKNRWPFEKFKVDAQRTGGGGRNFGFLLIVAVVTDEFRRVGTRIKLSVCLNLIIQSPVLNIPDNQ